jgi:hypothetical protein
VRGKAMKKILLILTIMLMCLMPVTVLADGPGPSNYYNYVLIDDCSNISRVQFWGYDKDNNYKCIDECIYPKETCVPNERIEYFYNCEWTTTFEPKCKSFQLVIGLKNGETVRSNFVDFVDFGNYIYSVKDNTLKEGKITTRRLTGFAFFELILPMLFTVIIEWLMSLFFKLKPGKYVVIINFISNPIMNILLIISANYLIRYGLSLILLELIVMGAEFWFYTWKYKGYSKKRLLLFSLMANAASWGLYSLFTAIIGLA